MVFDGAVRLGADWLEATKGQPLTPWAYQGLYAAGFVDCRLDELFSDGFFDDWGDYLWFSQQEYDERPIRKRAKEDKVLANIEQERSYGLIPSELLSGSKRYTEPNPNNPSRSFSRYGFTYCPADGLAEPSMVIERYYRLLLLSEIADRYPAAQDKLTQERIIKIVLGFNPQNNMPTSGFLSEVKKLATVKVEVDGKSQYVSAISDEEIEELIISLEAQDYIETEVDHRQDHIEAILKAGGWSTYQTANDEPFGPQLSELLPIKPEYFYDPAKKIIVALGRNAISEFSPDEGLRYLKIMQNAGRLIVESSREDKTGLIDFKEMLTSEDIKIDTVRERTKKNELWDADDCLAYGRWIIDIMQRGDNNNRLVLTRKILDRSFHLYTGSSTDRIVSIFGSISHFYTQLEALHVRRQGEFDHWSRDQAIEHLRRIGRESGRVPTISKIKKRVDGKIEPSTWVLSDIITGDKDKFGAALEASGFVNTNSWDEEDYLKWGLAYRLGNENEMPTSMAIFLLSRKGFSPSTNSFRRRFQNLTEFNEILSELPIPDNFEALGWDKGSQYLYENLKVDREETKRIMNHYHHRRTAAARAKSLAIKSA